MLYWLMIVACLMMLIGFCTPFSCLVLLIVWSQLALVSPSADRGIDTLLRNMLFILMFSGSGRCLSVDALIRGKGLMNEGLRCMAWPRYLIMLQVVVMYLAAGVEKMSFSWTPFGGYSALYLILQDWAVTRYTFEWLGAQPYFLFTQIGTALSLFWEWSAPLLLVAHYHRVTAGPNSKLRRFTAKVPVRTLWLIVGFGFHSMLIITMELGIFPFAMMATYVIFFDPEEWRAFFVKYGFIPPLGTSV
jgi:hypothetical protein